MQIYNSFFNFNNKNNQSFSAKPLPPKLVKTIDNKFKQAETGIILCHSGTDNDTLCAAQLLSKYLDFLGIKVRIIVEGSLKGLYVNDSCKSVIYNSKNLKDLNNVDVCVALDFNSTKRAPKGVADLLTTFNKNKIIGFDHHEPECNLIKGTSLKKFKLPFYTNTESMSCCSILLRFFERLGIKLNQEMLGYLYCGLLDDMSKSGCIEIKRKNNVYSLHIVEEKADAIDGYTKEILKKIEEQLLKPEKQKILKQLDILSNLTADERAFQKELFKNIKFTDNKRLAYVIIKPGNELWNKIGKESPISAKIISDFRQRLLKNSKYDKLIPEWCKGNLRQIDSVAVFFSGPEGEQVYKFAVSSHDVEAINISKEMNKIYENLDSGGHNNRVGGKIYTNDKTTRKDFVKNLLNIVEKQRQKEKSTVDNFNKFLSVTQELAATNS